MHITPQSHAFLGDCMEGMAGFPDGYFDLAIVDPPYGIGHSVGAGKQSGQRFGNASARKGAYAIKDWDNAAPESRYFDLLNRKSKRFIIWGANHFIDNIPFNINSPCWILWDKENGKNDFADGELALTNFESALRVFRFTWNGMIQHDMKNKETRIHPTQKPVKLYKWLLKNYAKEGDKIFDPNMGIQSSRIAAYDMGFDYWGCELDPDYFNEGNKRFENFKLQQKLF